MDSALMATLASGLTSFGAFLLTALKWWAIAAAIFNGLILLWIAYRLLNNSPPAPNLRTPPPNRG